MQFLKNNVLAILKASIILDPSHLKKGRNNFNWCSHITEENNFNSKVGLILVARMPVVMSAS